MIFIFGGAYQGKLEYALKRFRLEPSDAVCCDGEGIPPDLTEKKIICHFEQLVLYCVRNGLDAPDYVRKLEKNLKDRIVIMDDISRGVVPMDPLARRWREANGRVSCFLSSRASETVHVFCGLAETLGKDEEK